MSHRDSSVASETSWTTHAKPSPPPRLLPLTHPHGLSPSPCLPTHGFTGVFHSLSLGLNYWHSALIKLRAIVEFPFSAFILHNFTSFNRVGERVKKGSDNKQFASQNNPNKCLLHISCLQLLEVTGIQNKRGNIRSDPDSAYVFVDTYNFVDAYIFVGAYILVCANIFWIFMQWECWHLFIDSQGNATAVA